ncbi:hypothetical protein GPECTOR_15g339 [Gonium pectorale]|uniref:Uncharacterized protein n=1 Tax=Gonium pectorale TaxID=33097 RepID=A0A150GLN5_GONPE|nr:hypothetical protein GPECTOR_15g339 [Gonium pectorale]|eukprot:KXZ50655.1 hypothetical protein GPECTOR_15g339 [Gonium pectorale]
MSFILTDVVDPLGSAPTLASLALPRLFGVPQGANLVLEDVVLLLAQEGLTSYLQSLCSVSSTSAYPYSPGVQIRKGVVHLMRHASRAPGGGEVVWRNVTLTCPGYGVPGFVCAASAVSSEYDLRDWMNGIPGGAVGPVYLSVAANVSIKVANWSSTVELPWGLTPVLLGDPLRPTLLDLGGLEGAWTKLSENGGSFMGASRITPLPQVAELHDLTLVNLPYGVGQYASGPTLMAVGMASFNIFRGSVLSKATQVQLTLRRCTLVVSDAELAFLAGVGQRPDASPVASLKLGGWRLEVNASQANSANDMLVVSRLSIGTQVLLLNCTLLSASVYEALPEAVQLLPLSQVWPPLLLHGDEQKAMRL